MAIPSDDQIFDALAMKAGAGGQRVIAHGWGSLTSGEGVRLQSAWQMFFAAAGLHQQTPPTNESVALERSTYRGVFPYVAPAAGKDLYIIRYHVLQFGVGGSARLYDRLVHKYGFVANIATLQAVNTAALPARAAGATDVQAFLEVYSSLGGTPQIITVIYTNQAGVGGRTGTVSLNASSRAGTFFPVDLQSGDTGVQSVESVQLPATTGSAGGFAVVLARQIGLREMVLYRAGARSDFTAGPFSGGLPKLPAEAVPFPVVWSLGTSADSPSFALNLIEN